MDDKHIQEFIELVTPLYEWLQDNYNPHDSIIIESGQAKIVSDRTMIPLKVRD